MSTLNASQTKNSKQASHEKSNNGKIGDPKREPTRMESKAKHAEKRGLEGAHKKVAGSQGEKAHKQHSSTSSHSSRSK